MSMPVRTSLLSLVAAFVAVWLSANACAHIGLAENRAAMDNDKQDSPRLHVRGTAELDKPADQLRMSIGVVTEHADPSQALSANTRRMQAVVDAVERAGLGEGEYETGRFQIRPVYSQRPPRQQVDHTWRPEIVAYSVTNTINVRTRQLQLAGEIIQAANQAGANTIDSIQFTLADARVHRAEAIAVATTNARSDAEALAEAAGVRLVRVMDVRLDDPQPIRPFVQGHERAVMAMDEAAPPITPGEVTVRASVSLVYEIAPAN